MRHLILQSTWKSITWHSCVCVFSWCCHPGVRQTLQGSGAIIRFPRESNRLIELPEDYSVLINQASSFTSVNTQWDQSDRFKKDQCCEVLLWGDLKLCRPIWTHLSVTCAGVRAQAGISLALPRCAWCAAACCALRVTAVRRRWTARTWAPAPHTPSPAELASAYSSGNACTTELTHVARPCPANLCVSVCEQGQRESGVVCSR